jgi:hypothetical protein
MSLAQKSSLSESKKAAGSGNEKDGASSGGSGHGDSAARQILEKYYMQVEPSKMKNVRSTIQRSKF